MSATEADTPGIPLHLGPGESGTEPSSPMLLADPVGYFTSGFRKHGPVFRTRFRGTDWTTIAGIEANDFFWQNTSDWSYEAAGAGFRSQFGPTYVTQLDGVPHLRKRRLLKAAFSAEAVGSLVQGMALEAGRFLADIRSWSADSNVWVPALLLSMNKETLLKTELTRTQMLDAIQLEGELIYGVAVSANPHSFFGRPEYVRLKAGVFEWLDKILRKRLEGAKADDNLQALIDQDPGNLEPLSREELLNDAYMLLVAGIHNTAKLLTRIIERISHDPDWVSELRAEVAGSTAESFTRGVGKYPKLRATILEGERLHPGGTFLRRRPIKDLPFAGLTIPADRPVMQAHTLPHFLPEYYHDPLVFNPRRWLEGEPPQRKALADFGGGAHICLGMNISRIQIPIILAELLRSYDWRLDYNPKFWLTVDPGDGLHELHEPIWVLRRG